MFRLDHVSKLSLFFLIPAAYSVHAKENYVYECQETYPDDHYAIQALIDSVPIESTIRLKGVCEFEPENPSEPLGWVSILRDGVALRGPATIKGGAMPVRIGIDADDIFSVPFCSDPYVSCVPVQNVSVEKLTFKAPLSFGISVQAAKGNIELSQNTVYSPRAFPFDLSRAVGFPAFELLSGCIVVASFSNSDPVLGRRFAPDLVTGQITIRHNTCFGEASISDENDADAIFDGRVGLYTKGAYRGINIGNVDANLSIHHNTIENTFQPAILINADSALFNPRSTQLRFDIEHNIVRQSNPDIAAAGFFPSGIHTALDPNVNKGPQFINRNSVLIDQQVVGIGAGMEARGLANFKIEKNDVAIMADGLFSWGISVNGSRQGPSGPGLVSKNRIYGNSLTGILIGDGDPLFGNPPGLFGFTSDIFLEKNDLSELTTQFADVIFQSDSASNIFEGDVADSVIDYGTDNTINLH